VRLDDAVTWFLGSWPYEGPRVPTADTVRNYSQSLKWLSVFALRMGRRFVDDLDADLLKAAIKETLEERKERSPLYKGGEATARTLVCATRKLAGWLLAQGMPVADLSGIRPPRVPERIQPRLKPDEFRRLEQAVLRQLVEPNRANPRVTVARGLALLYLLGDTGLRASEVCSMHVTDVDFDVGRVTVRRGKGRKQRSLSILDPSDSHGGQTLRLLAEWIKARGKIGHNDQHPYLFTSMRGNPLDREGLSRILRLICQDAGLDGNRPPHSFRRATFTEQYRAEPSAIKVLSARMGWSDRSHHMVNVYTRGAELEFAAEVNVPSMSSRWHEGDEQYQTKVPIRPGRRKPILVNGVSPGGAETTARRRQPSTDDDVRTASVMPQRGSRHQVYGDEPPAS
jgi:integrase